MILSLHTQRLLFCTTSTLIYVSDHPISDKIYVNHDVTIEMICPYETTLLQYVGDNTYHNLATVDGKNMHHGLGSIDIANGKFKT